MGDDRHPPLLSGVRLDEETVQQRRVHTQPLLDVLDAAADEDVGDDAGAATQEIEVGERCHADDPAPLTDQAAANHCNPARRQQALNRLQSQTFTAGEDAHVFDIRIHQVRGVK